MGHFLDVARKVLLDKSKPLSAAEITQVALERGWLRTKGKTPSQTMKSKLSTEILAQKSRSPFMRASQATFALREWKGNGTSEYIASRYQKALLEEEVIVFPAALLDRYVPGPGLYARSVPNGRELLLESSPMGRLEAEEDPSVIQLVSVFVVHHDDRYLTHKRTKRLPESRLHGEYSMFFGGHLNPGDLPTLFNVFESEASASFMTRELEEEVVFARMNLPEIRYTGLLYDDSRPVSRQHLGVVYDVSMQTEHFEIGERGFLMDPKLETLKQIQGRLEEFENWSAILLDFEMKQRRPRR